MTSTTQKFIQGTATVDGNAITIIDETKLVGDTIDHLVREAIFGIDEQTRNECRWLIRKLARARGVLPSSIHELYTLVGKEGHKGFTVPAINIRGMTYDFARMIFRTAMKHAVGAMIIEIARSEMGYTDQSPSVFTPSVLAAAVKEGFTGRVFLQEDHVQVKAEKYFAGGEDKEKELQKMRDLMVEGMENDFYNIDIDASTLEQMNAPTLDEQQKHNYETTYEYLQFIREHQPGGVTISVGGEIGEVGKELTNVDQFTAFMDGLTRLMKKDGAPMLGISKAAINTGSSHGGIPLPDGSIKKVDINFDMLKAISETARANYGVGGTVQHGASTLPEEYFDHFTKNEAVEIHLATGFQNIMFDHAPKSFLKEMYEYLDKNEVDERKADQTDEQFHYKTRKKAFGPFKKQWWDLPADVNAAMMNALAANLEFYFQKLNVVNTKRLVDATITHSVPEPRKPENM